MINNYAFSNNFLTVYSKTYKTFDIPAKNHMQLRATFRASPQICAKNYEREFGQFIIV